ncbi:YwbE family protein [Methanococcoides sp. FTZ1]|uniref:YwbE family protein n=1 Tax=Methanococcoides sp. FTZ1 TaxID=3439061 RepID=UPI003F830E23
MCIFQNGQERFQHLKIGLDVGILLKQDQKNGKITRGIAKRILTNSSSYPHGIKVQLEDDYVEE